MKRGIPRITPRIAPVPTTTAKTSAFWAMKDVTELINRESAFTRFKATHEKTWAGLIPGVISQPVLEEV